MNSQRRSSCCLKRFLYSTSLITQRYTTHQTGSHFISQILAPNIFQVIALFFFFHFVFLLNLCRPDFAAAWMNLGIVQNSLQKFEEAEHSYWNAIHFRKKYPDCYYNLGRLVRLQHVDNVQQVQFLKTQKCCFYRGWVPKPGVKLLKVQYFISLESGFTHLHFVSCNYIFNLTVGV